MMLRGWTTPTLTVVLIFGLFHLNLVSASVSSGDNDKDSSNVLHYEALNKFSQELSIPSNALADALRFASETAESLTEARNFLANLMDTKYNQYLETLESMTRPEMSEQERQSAWELLKVDLTKDISQVEAYLTKTPSTIHELRDKVEEFVKVSPNDGSVYQSQVYLNDLFKIIMGHEYLDCNVLPPDMEAIIKAAQEKVDVVNDQNTLLGERNVDTELVRQINVKEDNLAEWEETRAKIVAQLEAEAAEDDVVSDSDNGGSGSMTYTEQLQEELADVGKDSSAGGSSSSD